MRAVVDTNVFLSALLGGRSTRPILSALVANQFNLVISETLVGELNSVLGRREWVRVLDTAGRREFLAMLGDFAILVRPAEHVTVCWDPEDNAILDCAIAGHVGYVVTGDKDLLVLDRFRGVRILRPSDFLHLLV